jgi:hypothetical protein
MGPETIFYAGQCHRLVNLSGIFCTFPFRGMFVLVPPRASQEAGLHTPPRAINDSHSCRFALRSIAWRS